MSVRNIARSLNRFSRRRAASNAVSPSSGSAASSAARAASSSARVARPSSAVGSATTGNRFSCWSRKKSCHKKSLTPSSRASPVSTSLRPSRETSSTQSSRRNRVSRNCPKLTRARRGSGLWGRRCVNCWTRTTAAFSSASRRGSAILRPRRSVTARVSSARRTPSRPTDVRTDARRRSIPERASAFVRPYRKPGPSAARTRSTVASGAAALSRVRVIGGGGAGVGGPPAGPVAVPFAAPPAPGAGRTAAATRAARSARSAPSSPRRAAPSRAPSSSRNSAQRAGSAAGAASPAGGRRSYTCTTPPRRGGAQQRLAEHLRPGHVPPPGEQQPADRGHVPRVVEGGDRQPHPGAAVGGGAFLGVQGDGRVVVQPAQQGGVAGDLLPGEGLLIAGRHPGGVRGRVRGGRGGGPALGAPHDVLVEHRPHGPAVVLVVGDEPGGVGEVQPPGEVPQLPGVLRQAVDLSVVPQLEGVLDGPQEVVAGGELAVLVRPEQPAVGQPGQRVEGAGGPHAGLLAAVGQLQALGGELDVADAAGPALDLAPLPALLFEVRLDPPLGLPHAGPDLLRGGGIDVRLGVLQEPPAEVQVAGDRPGLQQGLPLPGAGVLRQVRQVGGGGVDQRPAAAPGPQPHVDAVQEPLAGGLREGLDEPLAELPVGRRVAVGEERQVDVGGIVQLLPAELPEGQHAELRGVDVQFVRQQVQAGLREPVRQQRELRGNPLEVQQAERVAGPDPQQFPVLVAAEGVQPGGGRGQPLGHREGLQEEVRPAFILREPAVLREPAEVVRVLDEDVGQVLAADEQPDQDLHRPRVAGEVVEQGARRLIGAGEAGAGEPLEVHQAGVGGGGVRQRRQQRGEGPGEDGVGRRPGGGEDRVEPPPGRRRVRERDGVQRPQAGRPGNPAGRVGGRVGGRHGADGACGARRSGTERPGVRQRRGGPAAGESPPPAGAARPMVPAGPPR